jgi:hypothetical protein
MSDDYLWDRSGPPDPEVERLEALLSPLAHDAPLDELRLRRRSRRPWFVLGIAVAAAAAVVLYVALPRGAQPRGAQRACGAGGPGFAFAGEGGAVSCNGSTIATGVLPIGGELATGAHGARLAIADIGDARLGPDSVVRLERTDAERHHLALARGRMHAKVVAPPRLFAVSTPTTDVIDLGCEYTIEVDAAGRGTICVQDGLVELATKAGAVVAVPLGACANLLAEDRLGLVVAAEASDALRAAVEAYDHGVTPRPEARAAVLAAAAATDAITLVGLATLEPADRAAVLARLADLVPPPAGITAESAARDPAQLEAWAEEVLVDHVNRVLPGPQ